MSRAVAMLVFAGLAAVTWRAAVSGIVGAAAAASLGAAAHAAYGAIRACIVSAFAVSVALRTESRRPSRDPVAFGACAAAIVAVVALAAPAAGTTSTRVLGGEAVAVLACVWLLASAVCLGRCFGVLPEVRGLVVRGPYRLVRHPVYLGELAACGGLLLAAPTLRNLIAATVFAGAQVVRIRLEERALRAEFPGYGAYAARTPMLVPRLLGLSPARAPLDGVRRPA